MALGVEKPPTKSKSYLYHVPKIALVKADAKTPIHFIMGNLSEMIR